MKRRVISFLLALCMMLSLLPTAAFGAEDDCDDCVSEGYSLADKTDEDTVPEAVEPASHFTILRSDIDTAAFVEPAVPVLQGITYTDAERPATFRRSVPAYTTDISAAAELLRECMKARENEIHVYYQINIDGSENLEDVAASAATDIYNQALKHTGVGNEGDYLLWTINSVDAALTLHSDETSYYIDFAYELSYYTTPEQEAELTAKVDEVISGFGFTTEVDAYTVVKTVYDYICDNVSYDYSNDGDMLKHTAYAAMMRESAVCQGYATLLYRMLLQLGIDCRLIPGDSDGDGVSDHAWNIVGLDSLYYNADSTWDAGASEKSFFLVGSDHFADHIRDAAYDTEAFYASYPMAESDYVEAHTEEYIENGIVYHIFANQATVVGYSGNPVNVVLPETVAGTPVVKIGDTAFSDCTTLKSITIPATVEIIVGNAGYWAGAIGAGEPFGSGAFSNCTELASITIPENSQLTCIGGMAFAKTKISEIFLPDTVEAIGVGAFYMCEYLESLTLPENLEIVEPFLVTNCLHLQELVLGEQVESIGYMAIAGCRNLEELVLPASLKSIDRYAFNYCLKIEEITIPAQVEFVGYGAFCVTPALESIAVNPANPYYQSADGILFNKDLTVLIACPGGFSGGEYRIPESVATIFPRAFSYCDGLTNVIIPDSVTEIGFAAFSGCFYLTNVELSASIKTISDYLFEACFSLNATGLLENIEEVGKYGFERCLFDENLTIPSNIKRIGSCAFAGNNVQTLTFADDDIAIDEYAFANCGNLLEVTISDALLAKIDEDTVFLGSPWLGFEGDCGQNLIYRIKGRKMEIVGRGEMDDFWGWNSPMASKEYINEIIISDSVTYIGENAFVNNVGVTSIVIPEKVVAIGSGAFDACTNLHSFTILNKDCVIPDLYAATDIWGYSGSSAEEYAKERQLVFHDLGEAPPAPDGGDESEGIAAEGTCGDALSWSLSNGVLRITGSGKMHDYDGNERSAPWYGYRRSIIKVVLEEGATYVGNKAFDMCINLEEVVLPSTLTRIGTMAFMDCHKLKQMEIPSSVSFVGESAFANCFDLTSLVLPDGMTSIEPGLFSGCESLSNVTLPSELTHIYNWAFAGTAISTLDLPQSICYIGENAFNRCSSLSRIDLPEQITFLAEGLFMDCVNLTEIYIPQNVTSVRDSAFYRCEKLNKIQFAGDAPQIGADAFYDVMAVVYYPVDNLSWTSSAMQGYGGDITWKSYCADRHTGVVDVAVEATCTTDGKTEGKHCSVCDAVIVAQEIVPATGHTEVIDAAVAETCTTAGKTEGKHCSVCGEVLTAQEVIEALGHDEIIHEAQTPTCTESGWDAYVTCGRCDYSTYEEIAATGHKEVTIPGEAATCGESGVTDGKYCSVCGIITVNQQSIPAIGHTWGTGVVTAPTCTEDGYTTYTCNTCGHSYIENIVTTLGHIYNCVVTDATCTQPGYTTYTCECGYSFTDDIVAALGHTEVTVPGKAATCTESGLTDGKKCSVCGVVTVAQKTIAAKGHTEVTVAGKAATCTETGLTDGKKCSVCGTITVAQQAIPTTAHQWSDWTERAEDTYQRACADCGASETMVIDKPVNTTPEDNAADTVLGDSDMELIDKVLTDKEQSQVAQGSEVNIYLQVEDISEEVSDEHKSEAESKIGDSEIGMYLDINLFKQVGGAEAVPVSETEGLVTVIITIPEELRNGDPTVTRIYQIIRVHETADGRLVTDVIEGVFNAEDNSFTFETDKFSTYVLVYADESAIKYLLGDANLDGSVDSMDTNILFRYASEDPTLGALSAEQLLVADANQDGSVDSMDTNILFRYASEDATLTWTPVTITGNKKKED